MPILQDIPLQITIDGLDVSLNQLRQRLDAGNYPNMITVTERNTRNFIRFYDNGNPNRYGIEAGNNPDGFGRRHAAASCDRDDVKQEIMRFFGVDQFGGRAHRRTRVKRRAQRSTKRNRARN